QRERAVRRSFYAPSIRCPRVDRGRTDVSCVNHTSRLAPTPTTRRFNGENVAGSDPPREFRWKFFPCSVSSENVRSASALLTPVQSVGPKLPTVGQECDLSLREETHFANDAVAASPFASSAGTPTKRISCNPNGVSVLKCFNRRVERVRHVGMNTGKAVHRWSGSHPSGDGLVIGDRLPCWGIDSTECKVVHRALAGRGNSVRHRVSETSIKNVHNSLRRLHIAAAHGRRWTCIHHRAFRSNDLERAHASGVRRYR